MTFVEKLTNLQNLPQPTMYYSMQSIQAGNGVPKAPTVILLGDTRAKFKSTNVSSSDVSHTKYFITFAAQQILNQPVKNHYNKKKHNSTNTRYYSELHTYSHVLSVFVSIV